MDATFNSRHLEVQYLRAEEVSFTNKREIKAQTICNNY